MHETHFINAVREIIVISSDSAQSSSGSSYSSSELSFTSSNDPIWPNPSVHGEEQGEEGEGDAQAPAGDDVPKAGRGKRSVAGSLGSGSRWAFADMEREEQEKKRKNGKALAGSPSKKARTSPQQADEQRAPVRMEESCGSAKPGIGYYSDHLQKPTATAIARLVAIVVRQRSKDPMAQVQAILQEKNDWISRLGKIIDRQGQLIGDQAERLHNLETQIALLNGMLRAHLQNLPSTSGV